MKGIYSDKFRRKNIYEQKKTQKIKKLSKKKLKKQIEFLILHNNNAYVDSTRLTGNITFFISGSNLFSNKINKIGTKLQALKKLVVLIN